MLFRSGVFIEQLGSCLGMPPVNLSRDFFFQAEDGIRDIGVTGVQTCALPISGGSPMPMSEKKHRQNASV